ncbi:MULTISPECIES: hypothetical protein [Halostella]|uniref:hypothetical protein n=1 Tax=Halostella TaxID=1843185 RepID=UPI00143D7BC5|nr:MULTISPECIES: hypothetical protein [Halostella]
MERKPEAGGIPQTFARCTECGTIYPAQLTDDDNLRPVGTDGSCSCGNDEFEPPALQ